MATQAFEVLRGQSTIADTSSTVTITESTDYTLPVGADSTNCFIRLVNTRKVSAGENDGSNSDMTIPNFAVRVNNPGNIATSITFTREGTGGAVEVNWEIVCYVGPSGGANEFIVRAVSSVSGTGQTLTGTTVTTISDNADVVVFITGVSHDASDSTDWHKALFHASLVANASDWDPTFDKDVADTAGTTGATVSYAVVEWVGSNWTVDRVETTAAGTGSPWSGTNSASYTHAHGVTIPTLAKACIIEMQFASNDDPTACIAAGDAVYLDSTSDVRVWRRSSANTHRHVWWILQNSQNDGTARNMNVQRVQYADETASATHPYNLTRDLTTNPVNSVNAGSLTAPLDEVSIVPSASNEDTGTWYPRGALNVWPTGANQLTMETQDASQHFRWAVEVIEWPEDPVTAPDFSAGPTVTGQTTTTYNLSCTADADCTFYQVTLKKDSAAPSIAQIKAGTDASDNAAPSSGSTALTSGVPAAPAITTFAAPINDIYMVLSNGGGDSAIYSLLDEQLAPATGKQHVTVAVKEITAASKANPCRITVTGHGFSTGQQCRIWGVGGMTELNDGGDKSPSPDDGLLYYEATVVDANTLDLDDIDSTAFTTYTSGGYITPGVSVFADASPAVVDGDLAIVDTTTDPGGYAVTFNADGTFSYPGGDEARQSIVVDVYDVDVGSTVGETTFYVNNQPPSWIGASIPIQSWSVGEAISPIDLTLWIEDAEGDGITFVVSSLPAGVTQSTTIIVGTPTATANGTVSIRATDAIGEYTDFTFTYAVLEDEPDVDEPVLPRTNISVAAEQSDFDIMQEKYDFDVPAERTEFEA